MAAAGFRTVPHTADLRIEAWAPDRNECLAQAVIGLVDSFADVAAARPVRTARVPLTAPTDADLLVAALEEVIYRVDADDEIPVAVTVGPMPGGSGVTLTLALARLGSVEITGAAPKAVSLHELACSPDSAGRWSASVTIDV